MTLEEMSNEELLETYDLAFYNKNADEVKDIKKEILERMKKATDGNQ